MDCNLMPIAFASDFRVRITDHGISCSIFPTKDKDGKLQNILFPEVKCDVLPINKGGQILNLPGDTIKYSNLMFDLNLDADLGNYMGFYNWMLVGKLEQMRGFADVIIDIMNPATFTPRTSVLYKDCCVVNISPVTFDITSTEPVRFTVAMKISSFSLI